MSIIDDKERVARGIASILLTMYQDGIRIDLPDKYQDFIDLINRDVKYNNFQFSIALHKYAKYADIPIEEFIRKFSELHNGLFKEEKDQQENKS